MKFLGQRRDVRLDNLMARGQLLLASLNAPASQRFQIINIKYRNVIESGHSRIDVTRHRAGRARWRKSLASAIAIATVR